VKKALIKQHYFPQKSFEKHKTLSEMQIFLLFLNSRNLTVLKAFGSF